MLSVLSAQFFPLLLKLSFLFSQTGLPSWPVAGILTGCQRVINRGSLIELTMPNQNRAFTYFKNHLLPLQPRKGRDQRHEVPSNQFLDLGPHGQMGLYCHPFMISANTCRRKLKPKLNYGVFLVCNFSRTKLRFSKRKNYLYAVHFFSPTYEGSQKLCPMESNTWDPENLCQTMEGGTNAVWFHIMISQGSWALGTMLEVIYSPSKPDWTILCVRV